MIAHRRPLPRLTIEDLIDLEMKLHADRERDHQDLRRRDAEIGRDIDACRLAAEGREREMFLAWLARVRETTDPRESSPGRQVKLFLEVVGLALALLGLGLGFGAVTGWLRMNPTEPVNAIFFWAVIVGVQILLLAVWLSAVFPTAWLRRLPGAEAFQLLLRVLARLLPLGVAWIAARLSPEHRLLLGRVRGTLQSWSWIYGNLQFWTLVGLTQIFAVAYNLGALVAFVAISYGNDPAFGWKSRLLTPEKLHGLVQVISAPWRWFWPAAAPTLEHLVATRYSSLDPRYLETFPSRHDGVDAWVLWWPFLLACLLFYGLLPRLLTLAISQGQVRRALRQVRLDHGDFYKLKDRLTRPLVETQARSPEAPVSEQDARQPTAPIPREANGRAHPAATPHPASAPLAQPQVAAHEPSHATAASERATPPPGPPPAAVQLPARTAIKWVGVNLEDQALADLVRKRLRVEPTAIYTVGDLQGKGDQTALAAVENDGSGEVLLIVEAWEPPIADYVDFLADLRTASGRERTIVVLLYHRDPDGRPMPPRPRDAQVWRDQLATLGDPWLCVEELVEATTAAPTPGAHE